MWSRILFLAVLLCAFGSTAKAGVIGVSSEAPQSVLDATDMQELVSELREQQQQNRKNLDERNGDDFAISLSSSGIGSGVQVAASSSITVIPVNHPHSWLTLHNDLIPPSPLLDGLLKPA